MLKGLIIYKPIVLLNAHFNSELTWVGGITMKWTFKSYYELIMSKLNDCRPYIFISGWLIMKSTVNKHQKNGQTKYYNAVSSYWSPFWPWLWTYLNHLSIMLIIHNSIVGSKAIESSILTRWWWIWLLFSMKIFSEYWPLWEESSIQYWLPLTKGQ